MNGNSTGGYNQNSQSTQNTQRRDFGQQRKPFNRDNNRDRGFNKPRPPFGHQDTKFGGPQDIKEGVVRVIPLGGVEEVGRNMTMFEIGEDIVIVDMGFAFKEESAPGVDYILPNTQYLERKHKILWSSDHTRSPRPHRCYSLFDRKMKCLKSMLVTLQH